MKKMITKAAAVTLALAMVGGALCYTGCSKKHMEASAALSNGTTQVTSTAYLNNTAEKSLEERLKELDGVVSVKPVEVSAENKASDRFQGRYLVEFEQPIDWENPDLGTFKQRVFVGFSETADVTCYSCGGYSMNDVFLPTYFETADVQEDIKSRYDANYVELEYRFFAESAPEGLSFENDQYWKYMTSENASKDFHHVITELGKVMNGSTIFYGGSKGGYTTENMAYYFPDDIDAYVSYVAPLCDGTNDTRLYDALYTSIGDADPRYGTETAAHNRDVVKAMQSFLLKDEVRTVLQPLLTPSVEGLNLHISPLVTEDEAYEVAVVEFGGQIWQYLQNFDTYENVLAMPEGTEEEFQAKVMAAATLFFNQSTLMGIACDSVFEPYYIQCYQEMGALQINLSYLRDAGANIKTLPEKEVDLLKRLWCPLAVNANLKYDDAHRNEMIKFMDTTEKDIIKIVGLSDIWYAAKAPNTDNEHIHYFEVAGSHLATISSMDAKNKEECYAVLDSLLGK